MSIPRPNTARRFVPLAAALVLLAGCGDDPTAPDPLDAESLANRLEVLARRSPQADAIMLSAAGAQFRAAGRVTPITVVVDGQSETWYAASAEVVYPPFPCPPPSAGLSCSETLAIELRHIFAVDGTDATRLLVVSTTTAGGGSFGQQDLEWPTPRLVTGLLVMRGTGVTAFASGGSVTSSLVETLGDCPRMPHRPSPLAPRVESCERVSIAWEMDAEMTPLREGELGPATLDIAIPAVQVSGTRVVFAAPTLPER